MKKIYCTPQVEVIEIMAERLMDFSVKTGKTGKGTNDNFGNESIFDGDEQGHGGNNSVIWDN